MLLMMEWTRPDPSWWVLICCLSCMLMDSVLGDLNRVWVTLRKILSVDFDEGPSRTLLSIVGIISICDFIGDHGGGLVIVSFQ